MTDLVSLPPLAQSPERGGAVALGCGGVEVEVAESCFVWKGRCNVSKGVSVLDWTKLQCDRWIRSSSLDPKQQRLSLNLHAPRRLREPLTPSLSPPRAGRGGREVSFN